MSRAAQSARWVAAGGIGLALAVLLPVVFHQIGLGPVFLPMHIPILITGALGGARAGFAAGALAPALSHLLTGLPPIVPPVAPLMTVELACYGLVAGVARDALRKHAGPRRGAVAREYLWVIAALLAGRLALGVAAFLLGPMLNLKIGPAVYVRGAILAGLPGLIVQLVLIPPLVAWLGGLMIQQRARA